MIASNILTDRLKRLEETGIVSRRPDPDIARRLKGDRDALVAGLKASLK